MKLNQHTMEKPEAKEYLRETIYLHDPILLNSRTKKEPEKRQIFPDIPFWLTRVVQTKNLDDLFYPDGQIVSEVLYLEATSFYVSKDRYEKVASVLKELSIDPVHIDNLLVPLLKYEIAGKDLLLSEMKNATDDIRNLKELMHYLRIGYRPELFNFKIPIEWTWNKRRKVYEVVKTKNLTVKDDRIISVLSQSLERLYETDPHLKEFVEESDYNKFTDFNQEAYEKEQRMKCVFKAAEYLRHVNLYPSHSRASIILGGLFSTVGDVVDRDTFDRADENDSYSKVEELWRDCYRKELTEQYGSGKKTK